MLTDGVITLGPLRLEDASPHLTGEDAELVRWLNGDPGTAVAERAGFVPAPALRGGDGVFLDVRGRHLDRR